MKINEDILKQKAGSKIAHKLERILPKMSLIKKVEFARAVMKQRRLEDFKVDMVKGFSGEFADKARRDPDLTAEELTAEYLACPEWVEWWHDIGFNNEHLTVLAQEAVDNAKERTLHPPQNLPKFQHCPIGSCNKKMKLTERLDNGGKYRCPKHGIFIMGVR